MFGAIAGSTYGTNFVIDTKYGTKYSAQCDTMYFFYIQHILGMLSYTCNGSHYTNIYRVRSYAFK